MNKLWTDEGWDDYVYWQNQDRKTLNRINDLLKDIERNGVDKGLGKPEKLYMENPNILYAMTANADIGTVRETFFVNQLRSNHSLYYSGTGDFQVDEAFTFEVGGKGKTFKQIKEVPNSYLVVDDIEIGHAHRIPLWMFGLLY